MFEDEQFARAFPRQGAPAWSPGQLAMVSVPQFAEGLTDRQAADAVRGRIDVKYALGLKLDDPRFDFSVLSEFRDRLIAHGLEELVLDRLLDRVGEHVTASCPGCRGRRTGAGRVTTSSA